jgi:hypothetical protein
MTATSSNNKIRICNKKKKNNLNTNMGNKIVENGNLCEIILEKLQ